MDVKVFWSCAQDVIGTVILFILCVFLIAGALWICKFGENRLIMSVSLDCHVLVLPGEVKEEKNPYHILIKVKLLFCNYFSAAGIDIPI